jgi:glycosyltransferase A (GT-A) superfamily protein (DUF2064 family)
MIETLVVLAKRPVAGRVKTRLCPPFTAGEAAALADAALRDTLDTADRVIAANRVLAFRGKGDEWQRSGWQLVRQSSGSLDRRLAAALAAAGTASVLVGMDTPQLCAHHLDGVDLVRHDACLGLATDGGFWAIGLADHRLAHSALRGVAMSRSDTGAAQLTRLRALGLRVQLLDELTDVDTAESAHTVAAAAPQTRFAALHRQLVSTVDGAVA